MERFRVYSSPTFLLALGTLLANDLYLKATYPGWLTGKLSDFSGLIVMALLVFPLVRKHTSLAAGTIALAFVWWKSPLSQWFLDFWNGLGVIKLSRVVDYTDLIALSVLPFSVRVFKKHDARVIEATTVRRILFWPTVTFALMAVAGTSVPSFNRLFVIRDSEPEDLIPAANLSEALQQALTAEGYECDVVQDGPRRCNRDRIWVLYTVADGEATITIEGYGRGLLGANLKPTQREVDEFIRNLRAAIATQFEGLEYVEPLDPSDPLSPLDRSRGQ